MPRRPPKTKRRKPGERPAAITPLWEAIEDQATARENYLAARKFAGGPPVALDGETMLATRERIGGKPWPLWAAARFDPDPMVVRDALVTEVDFRRHQIVERLRGLRAGVAVHPEAPDQRPRYRFRPAGLPLRERVRAVSPVPSAGEEALWRGQQFEQLAEDAATVGLIVTEDAVRATKRRRRRA